MGRWGDGESDGLIIFRLASCLLPLASCLPLLGGVRGGLPLASCLLPLAPTTPTRKYAGAW
ncbi:hypothetical protein [Moorena sp. SIO3H5]|uniref:hypothetical protein n=1 Tax=Moorena sp. SIO3H5 TaxID=2607834 RepID=UPI0013B6E1A1|nr:hypothetical protein [Moorena sp. SIO3H5]NEO73469.1 hypothetical protein [Moorena sp. SIO3H5]